MLFSLKAKCLHTLWEDGRELCLVLMWQHVWQETRNDTFFQASSMSGSATSGKVVTLWCYFPKSRFFLSLWKSIFNSALTWNAINVSLEVRRSKNSDMMRWLCHRNVKLCGNHHRLTDTIFLWQVTLGRLNKTSKASVNVGYYVRSWGVSELLA